MKAYYSDNFDLPLPEGHRFPIDKYALLRKRALAEGVLTESDLFTAEPATDEQILLAHNVEYLEKVKHGKLSEKEIRRIGFPWSEALVLRSRRSVGGTIAACRTAIQEGISVNLAGGTHHAGVDHGEGFCVFNDVAIAARAVQAEGRSRKLVILDCDVHQGNGTAAIFSTDPSVFTFSIHGEKNFPFRKETSDLDVPLADGSDDDLFLDALFEGVTRALKLAQADLAVYIAGADPYRDDRLGRLGVTKQGLAQRDKMVFDLCYQAGLPVAIVMGGGYARQVEDTVDIHLQTIRIAARKAIIYQNF
jgi:acetoin utilization deacetylase AcuC-like enzyme